MNPVEIEMNFPAEHGGNVFGQFDAYMKKIEKTLHVSLILRGDHLKCIGTQQAVNHAISVIDELLELSKRGNVITEQNVNYALSLSMEEKSPSLLELDKDVICHTIQGKAVKPKTLGQQKYVDAIKNKMITFGVGPAGTGKTYLAMAMAITAFKNGVMDAKPVLLEPIVNLKVDVLDKNTGDVMGDLNKRRGRILGMNPLEGGRQELVADIPLASLIGYSTDLRSMTGGSGEFSYEFSRYEQMPADAQEKVLKEAAAEKENIK